MEQPLSSAQLSSKPAPERIENSSFSRKTFLLLKLGSFSKLRFGEQRAKVWARWRACRRARGFNWAALLEAGRRRRKPLGLLAAHPEEGEHARHLAAIRTHTLDGEWWLQVGEAEQRRLRARGHKLQEERAVLEARGHAEGWVARHGWLEQGL